MKEKKRISRILLLMIFGILVFVESQSIIASKPEGDVALKIEPPVAGKNLPLDEEFVLKLDCICNKDFEGNISAEILIESKEIDIDNGKIVLEDFNMKNYGKDNEKTESFVLKSDMLKENEGEITFSLNVRNDKNEIIAFSKRTLYYAKSDDQVYYTENSAEEAEEYFDAGTGDWWSSCIG